METHKKQSGRELKVKSVISILGVLMQSNPTVPKHICRRLACLKGWVWVWFS